MITSRQNSSYKLLKSLRTRSGREKASLYLLEGVRLVEEAIASGIPIRYAIYSDYLKRSQRGIDCLHALANLGVVPQHISDRLLCELADTERPQGILVATELPSPAIASDEAFWAAGKLFLLIDGVQDPGNLGTILRTAEAFGVDRVVALKGTVDPYNSKVIRSAMGAIFRLPLLHNQTNEVILKRLKQHDIQIVATALGESVPYHHAVYRSRVALVVGNEGAGVSSFWLDVAHLAVRIPIRPPAESLNVAVATGILLAQLAVSVS